MISNYSSKCVSNCCGTDYIRCIGVLGYYECIKCGKLCYPIVIDEYKNNGKAKEESKE